MDEAIRERADNGLISEALATYLQELVQRGRVDELAQKEHAPASGAEQVDRRLAERSGYAFADDVELDDRDLGIRRLVKCNAFVPQDATTRFLCALPDGPQGSADRLSPLQARRNTV